ncbi:MAG: hypothetical protein M0Q53_05765 [Prolixibacteraceae bacterium]|jgi:hypothetical protein|nr:hypothetical protein [Prolixibacteraceae bacterium]
MDDFAFYLVWLGFFASILLGWYFYLQARHKERMALIEKNADLSEVFKARENRFPWLKLGMTITGVGFGFCMVFPLREIIGIQNFGAEMEMAIFGFMMFFGGLGAVIGHFIDKPKER